MLGVAHLLSRVGLALPGPVAAVLGALGASLLASRALALGAAADKLDDFLAILVLTLCFSPLHGYDAVVALPLAAALPALRTRYLLWFAPAIVVFGRPRLLVIAFARVVHQDSALPSS